MMTHGFPNMLMPAGPQSGSASTNYPRGIETGVNWCTGLLQHIRERRPRPLRADGRGRGALDRHVTQMYSTMLMRKAKSWFTGYNSNVAGHEHGRIRYFVYNGGTPKYVSIISQVASSGYEGIRFSGARSQAA